MVGTTKFWLAECALLTLLVVSTLASPSLGVLGHPDNMLKYEIELLSSYQLGPQNTTAKINGFTEVYVRPYNDEYNVLSIALKNTRFSVVRNNGEEIDLPSCNPFLNPHTSRPYLAVYNDNGVLRKIKVHRNEDESMNLKFYVAAIFEINFSQIRGQSRAVETRKELLFTGVCPVKTELVKNYGPGVIRIRISGELTECDNVKNDVKNAGLECYGNTCSDATERNVKWPAYLSGTVTELNGNLYLEDAFVNQKISYNPFKNSNAQLSADITEKVRMVPVNYTEYIPIFYPTKTANFFGTRYKKINKNLCEVNDDKTDLRQLYSAVSCLQSLAEIQVILETALTCK